MAHLYITRTGAGSAFQDLWRVNPSDPDDTSGIYGEVGDLPINPSHAPTTVVSHNGALYVSSNQRELWRIDVSNPSDTSGSEFGQISGMMPFATGGSALASHGGSLYAAWHLDGEDTIMRLFRINPSNPADTSGNFGAIDVLPPDTRYPSGFTEHNGELYLVSSGLQELWRVNTSNPNASTRLGALPSSLFNPQGLASQDGILYAIEANNGQLWRINPSTPSDTSGDYGLIGSFPFTAGRFSRPQGITSHPKTLSLRASANLASISWNAVATLTETAAPDPINLAASGSIGAVSGTASHSQGPSNYLYAVGSGSDALFRLNVARPRDSVAGFGNLGDLPNGLNAVRGLTSHEGKLFAVDSGMDALWRIDESNPGTTASITGFGAIGFLPDGLEVARGITSHNGSLYVVGSSSDALWKINPTNPADTTGDYGNKGSFPSALSYPQGITSHGGALYVVGSDSRSLWRINEDDPDDVTSPYGLLGTLPTTLNRPQGLTSHNGQLYCVDNFGDSLWRINPDDPANTRGRIYGSIGALAVGLRSPQGLASHPPPAYHALRPSASIPSLTASGMLDMPMMPEVNLSASGQIGAVTASAELTQTTPMLALQASGTLAAPTGSASITQTLGIRANATMPSVTATASFMQVLALQARGTVPSVTATGSLTQAMQTIALRASATIPSVSGEASFNIINHLRASGTLNGLSATASLEIPVDLSASATLPSLSGMSVLNADAPTLLRASGSIGAVSASASPTLLVGLTASATIPSIAGSAELTLTSTTPSTSIELRASGTLPSITDSGSLMLTQRQRYLYAVGSVSDDLWLIDTDDSDNRQGKYGSVGSLPVGLISVRGLTAHNGELYAIDSGQDNLWKINDANPNTLYAGYGSLGRLPTGLTVPRGITSHDGEIYVVGSNSDRLWRINPTNPGDTDGDYGEIGQLPDGLVFPQGLTSHNGFLYAVGSSSDELWILDPSDPTNTESGFGSQGSLPTSLVRPQGLTSHNGHLFCVDSSSDTIWCINPSDPDDISGSYGRLGTLPIGLSNPQGLASLLAPEYHSVHINIDIPSVRGFGRWPEAETSEIFLLASAQIGAVTASALLIQTRPTRALQASGTMPSVTATGSLTQTAPTIALRASATIPSVSGRALLIQTRPTLDLRASATIPSVTGESTFMSTLRLRSSSAKGLSTLTGTAQLTQTIPMRALRASATIPSVAGEASFDSIQHLRASGTLASISATASLEIPVDLSASGNIPSVSGEGSFDSIQHLRASGNIPSVSGVANLHIPVDLHAITNINGLSGNATFGAVMHLYAHGGMPVPSGSASLEIPVRLRASGTIDTFSGEATFDVPIHLRARDELAALTAVARAGLIPPLNLRASATIPRVRGNARAVLNAPIQVSASSPNIPTVRGLALPTFADMPYPGVRIEIDWDGDGSFDHVASDVSDYVMPNTFSCNRGRNYAAQTVARAPAGQLSFSLWNFDHRFDLLATESAIAGIIPQGKSIRACLGPEPIWSGELDNFSISTKLDGVGEVSVSALGNLSRLIDENADIAPHQDISVADAAELVMSNSVITQTELGGDVVLGRWWIEGASKLEALRGLENAELGFLCESRDGKIWLQSRTLRESGEYATSAFTLSSEQEVANAQRITEIKRISNSVTVPVNSYTDGASATLWTAPSAIDVPAESSIEVQMTYPTANAPNDHVGAASWTSPRAGTDYTAVNGLDVTSETVGESLLVTFDNTTANQISVPSFKARGEPLIADTVYDLKRTNQDSVNSFGERVYPSPSQHHTSLASALSYADTLLSRHSTLQPVYIVTWDADIDWRRAAVTDLSRRITLELENESIDVFIEGITHQIKQGNRHLVTYFLTQVSGESRPYAPLAPMLRSESYTSIELTWIAPYSGGTAITGYDIEYRRVGDMEWSETETVSGNTTSATVTSLNFDDTYEFRIRSTNRHGDSLWSGISTGQTLRVLTIQELLATQVLGNGFTAVWTLPTFQKGQSVTSIRFAWREVGTTNWNEQTLGAGIRSASVLPPNPGRSYQWRVKIVDGARESDWSATQRVTLKHRVLTFVTGGSFNGYNGITAYGNRLWFLLDTNVQTADRIEVANLADIRMLTSMGAVTAPVDLVDATSALDDDDDFRIAQNDNWWSMTTDGTTLWVVGQREPYVRAYQASNGSRDSSKEPTLSEPAEAIAVSGNTLYCAQSGVLRAFSKSNGAKVSLDIQIPAETSFRDIHISGTRIWFVGSRELSDRSRFIGAFAMNYNTGSWIESSNTPTGVHNPQNIVEYQSRLYLTVPTTQRTRDALNQNFNIPPSVYVVYAN